MKFKSGDRVVIHSSKSHNNGRIVTIDRYTKGKRKDILQVITRSGKNFLSAKHHYLKPLFLMKLETLMIIS